MTATTTETGLDAHGISPRGRVIHNPTTAQLYTHALANGDGRLAHGGALVVDTGRFTGRSPQDKFVVDEDESRDRIWWGAVNHPLSEQHFDGLRTKVTEHLAGRDPLYVVDHFAGANPDHRVGVRVVTASPYHALFAKTMFIVPTARELVRFSVDALVLHAPDVEAVPEEDGTRTGTFVVLHPTRSEVVIGGTFYAGEIKKGIFSLMNDRLPRAGVLPMHCSANVGAEDGRVAVFFGLSGTGKTTLSADPDRSLIGDDEHGWSDSGVFNIEGGCYAKVIRLSAEAEPQIWRTTRTFGTILENVAVDDAGAVDLDDDSKTENTRAAYKLERIANALPTKRAGHPSSVVFLAADAFAVLPPIARLSRDQAMYWFLSGFTAKLAGTELGVTEPQPTFSTCFGAPFLPQPPAVYARHARREARPARRKRVAREHRLDGRAVRRRPPHADHRHARPPARRPLRRARRRPVPNGSGLRIRGAGLRPGRRQARSSTRAATWSDPSAYDAKAAELAAMFRANFETSFAADVDPAVAAAGPRPA